MKKILISLCVCPAILICSKCNSNDSSSSSSSSSSGSGSNASASADEAKVLQIISQVASDDTFNRSSYSDQLEALSPEWVARTAVIANAFFVGDAANKKDLKWYTLFILSLNHIANREGVEDEELLEAIWIIRNYTLIGAGDSYTLKEMEEEIRRVKD